MKLGSDTTSYTNYLLAKPRHNEPSPEVGMGATVLRRHDRIAGTITEVFIRKDRQYVRVQEDVTAVGRDSFGLADTANFIDNPAGAVYVFFKSANGYWQHVEYNKKRRIWEPCSAFSLRIGERIDNDAPQQ